MTIDPLALFELSRQALGTSQRELGEMLGVSRRTAQRWTATGIPGAYLADLARLVQPRDPALAVEIARAAGLSPEAAGIAQPAPSQSPPQADPPDWVVDAVVCAAAEGMDAKPHEVRAGLHAAFARAKEIGLSVEVAERVLRARVQRKRKVRAPSAKRRP